MLSNSPILCGCTSLSINTDTQTQDRQMFKSLLQHWFSQPRPYQTALDRYISTRRPQNAAELEHLIKEFETKISQGKYHEIIL